MLQIKCADIYEVEFLIKHLTGDDVNRNKIYQAKSNDRTYRGFKFVDEADEDELLLKVCMNPENENIVGKPRDKKAVEKIQNQLTFKLFEEEDEW